MMYFGIPLISKKVSADWQLTGKLLNATLRSILNQTEPNIHAIVACHEIPEVEGRDDPRLEFIRAEFPPPIFKQERIVDKHRKIEMIGARLRELGGGYLMLVDADDLVSKRLAEFVLNDHSPNGYIVDKGYEYDHVLSKVRKCPRFYRLSGSCGVFRWDPDDLPEEPLGPQNSRFRDLLSIGHPRWPAYMESVGRPLKAIPFRACMYAWNHGQHLSVLRNNVGSRRQLLRRLQFARHPWPELADDFNLEL